MNLPAWCSFRPFSPWMNRVESSAPGDVVAQTEAIFERAGRMLAALGLGFDRVVKTVDYITPAALARLQRHRSRAPRTVRSGLSRRRRHPHAAPDASRSIDPVRFHRRPRRTGRGQSGMDALPETHLQSRSACREAVVHVRTGRARPGDRARGIRKRRRRRRPSTPTRTCSKWWRQRVAGRST